MNLEEEMKKEYRKGEDWFYQFVNIFNALFNFLGLWLWTGITTVGFASIVWALMWDGDIPITYAEFQDAFKSVVSACGALSFVIVFFFLRPGKLRNVFFDSAHDRVQRYKSIKSRVDSEIEITESLLIKYGLITKEDINNQQQNQ